MRNKAVKYPLSVLSRRDREQKARVSTNGWFDPRCSVVGQKLLEFNDQVFVPAQFLRFRLFTSRRFHYGYLGLLSKCSSMLLS